MLINCKRLFNIEKSWQEFYNINIRFGIVLQNLSLKKNIKSLNLVIYTNSYKASPERDAQREQKKPGHGQVRQINSVKEF